MTPIQIALETLNREKDELHAEIARLTAQRDLWKERTEQGSLIVEANVAEVERLERHIKDLRELRDFDRTEIERLTALAQSNDDITWKLTGENMRLKRWIYATARSFETSGLSLEEYNAITAEVCRALEAQVMTTRITLTPEAEALHAFDAENNVEPCRTLAERIAERYVGADPHHSLVDDISHAIEDARDLGRRRAQTMSDIHDPCRANMEKADRALRAALDEIERLTALLNTVRIWMKNIDRHESEEPLYQAIRTALEFKL